MEKRRKEVNKDNLGCLRCQEIEIWGDKDVLFPIEIKEEIFLFQWLKLEYRSFDEKFLAVAVFVPRFEPCNILNPSLSEAITHRGCWPVRSYKIDRSYVLLSSWNQDAASWFLLSVYRRPNQLIKIVIRFIEGIFKIFAEYDRKNQLWRSFLSFRSWFRCRRRLFFADFSASCSRSSSFETDICRFWISSCRFSLWFEIGMIYGSTSWSNLSFSCSLSYSARRKSSSLRVLSTAECNKNLFEGPALIKKTFNCVKKMNFLYVPVLMCP